MYCVTGAIKPQDPARSSVLERGTTGGHATRTPLPGVRGLASGNCRATGHYSKIFKVDRNADYKFDTVPSNKIEFSTQPCKSKHGCKTCKYIDYNTVCKSNITGKKFCSMSLASCATPTVVYLITCSKCGIQYVGETVNTLRMRFGQHRNNIEKRKGNSLLVEHFNQANHSVSDVTVRILEVIHEIDRTVAKAKLKESEDFWIRLLNTAHPLGLNDRIKGWGRNRYI